MPKHELRDPTGALWLSIEAEGARVTIWHPWGDTVQTSGPAELRAVLEHLAALLPDVERAAAELPRAEGGNDPDEPGVCELCNWSTGRHEQTCPAFVGYAVYELEGGTGHGHRTGMQTTEAAFRNEVLAPTGQTWVELACPPGVTPGDYTFGHLNTHHCPRCGRSVHEHVRPEGTEPRDEEEAPAPAFTGPRIVP